MQEVIKALNCIYEKSLENLEETRQVKALLESLINQNRIKLFKEEWVDGQDISLALHINLRTLRSLRYSGQLPSAQVNDKYFYKYSDIMTLLNGIYFKNHPIKKT